MGAERDIQEAIKKLSGVGADRVNLVACTVLSVDIENRVCSGTTITGKSEMEIDNIQLLPGSSDGFMLVPAVGSMIYILYSVRNLPFVAMFSEIDGVVLICNNVVVNDGSFGGLVKIIDLTTKLNNLVAQMQTQLGLIATGIAGAGGSYSPGTLSQFSKADYENTQFKHGN